MFLNKSIDDLKIKNKMVLQRGQSFGRQWWRYTEMAPTTIYNGLEQDSSVDDYLQILHHVHNYPILVPNKLTIWMESDTNSHYLSFVIGNVIYQSNQSSMTNQPSSNSNLLPSQKYHPWKCGSHNFQMNKTWMKLKYLDKQADRPGTGKQIQTRDTLLLNGQATSGTCHTQ